MSKKGSIELSPKYGVNPSITHCFWCGKETGLAMLGRLSNGVRGGDFEAPKSIFTDYEPCDDCKASWAKGVAIIEVGTVPKNETMPPIRTKGDAGLYPTGRLVVMKREAADSLFKVPVKDRALMEEEVFEHFFGEALADD